jgi:hypothetical protein
MNWAVFFVVLGWLLIGFVLIIGTVQEWRKRAERQP